MKGYEVKVPTWYAMLNLVVAGAFALLFLYSALNIIDKPTGVLFFIVAVLFMCLFLGVSIYVVAKGRYPWHLAPRGKF